MIFGDPKEFAIEAYHEPSGPKWGGYGRFCLHIRGVPVGNIRENHCSLFAATESFRNFAEGFSIPWDECFAGLSDAEVFRLIDDDIYTDKPPSELGSGFRPCDFLTNCDEMFDGTKTFKFCDPDGLVHILYQLSDDTIGSGSCRIETLRRISAAYVEWFDEQVRATAPPYFPINPFDLNEKVPEDFNR